MWCIKLNIVNIYCIFCFSLKSPLNMKFVNINKGINRYGKYIIRRACLSVRDFGPGFFDSLKSLFMM